MVQPFEASELKIARAKLHFNELKREITDFLARGPVLVTVEAWRGPPPGFVHFIGEINEPVPTMLSGIIGDVIHNLRTSLDLLACDLVRLSKGEAASVAGVYFPFCSEKSRLSCTIKNRHLDEIAEAAVRAIEECAPYPGGNDGLRAIHDLDVLDKHQALIPVLGVISIRAQTVMFGGQTNQIPPLRTKLSHNRQLLLTMPESMAPPKGSRINSDLVLLFDQGTVFEYREFIPQLDACIAGVEETLNLFKRASSLTRQPPTATATAAPSVFSSGAGS